MLLVHVLAVLDDWWHVHHLCILHGMDWYFSLVILVLVILVLVKLVIAELVLAGLVLTELILTELILAELTVNLGVLGHLIVSIERHHLLELKVASIAIAHRESVVLV